MHRNADRAEFVPFCLIIHQVLELSDALQRFQALIQQVCCVVHQHIHKLHKVSSISKTEGHHHLQTTNCATVEIIKLYRNAMKKIAYIRQLLLHPN